MSEEDKEYSNEDNINLLVVENHLLDIDEDMNLYTKVIDTIFDPNYPQEFDQHRIVFQLIDYSHQNAIVLK
jgi:hypothetical protein